MTLAPAEAALPRLVFSDLDDSFLTRDKQVLPRNLEALDMLARRGVGFVPCTGRPLAGVPASLMGHPATRFAVASNGGVVASAPSGEVLYRSVMGTELVRDVYEAVRALNLTYDVFVDGHVLTERARYDAMASFGIDEATLGTVRAIREPQDRLVPELLRGATGVEKVTMYWADASVRDAAYQALGAFPELEVTTSHPRNIEFMAKGTSKGSALAWLCEHVGIDCAQTVAFGDSQNDVPMLVRAGDGVALANASDEVKSRANHVCGSCDEAGVGEYLIALLEP